MNIFVMRIKKFFFSRIQPFSLFSQEEFQHKKIKILSNIREITALIRYVAGENIMERFAKMILKIRYNKG